MSFKGTPAASRTAQVENLTRSKEVEEELLCAFGLAGSNRIGGCWCQCASHARNGAANRERRMKDPSNRQPAGQSMAGERFKSRRGRASAIQAVRFSAELTRRDSVLEVGRETFGRLREEALVGRCRRLRVRLEHPFGRLEFREQGPKPADLCEKIGAIA